MSLLPGSIRARLLVGLIVVMLGMNAALLSSSYTAARHEINEIFDAQLAQSARVLEGLLAAGTPESASVLRESLERHGWQGMGDYDEEDEAEDQHEGAEIAATGHEYESKLAFQLLDAQGRIQAKTLSAPAAPFTRIDQGYDTVRLSGRTWRVFVLPLAQSDGTLQVGQREDIRGELEGRIAWKTVQKSLYGMPLMALLVWLVVGLGLRPLSRLTETIRARNESDLGPIAIRAPRDLRPIVTALDSLFARLQRAWSRERRFLDEAAHELRTPLAAIQLHAESLAMETDPEARARSLDRLLQASNRGSHLASQLLTLARIESNEVAIALKPTALAPLLREEAALMAPLAERAGISLSLEAEPGLPAVRAEPGLLGLMLRNLIDNAIRHSPTGGTVHIRAHLAAGRASLRIEDEGPGIPASQRAAAMARFGRLSSNRQGSGLGLAICARIAEQHGAELELLERNGTGGLCVRIRLKTA